ncbi:unnamed protein product [Amoebophrya sp. A25]|nr:unnamed protein product [Amoebophrya sp. A25]|eukprot:GSA25T00009830001.1
MTIRSAVVRDYTGAHPEFSDVSSPEYIRTLCHRHVPQWDSLPPTMFETRVQKLTEGLTNQLFRVSLVRVQLPGGVLPAQDHEGGQGADDGGRREECALREKKTIFEGGVREEDGHQDYCGEQMFELSTRAGGVSSNLVEDKRGKSGSSSPSCTTTADATSENMTPTSSTSGDGTDNQIATANATTGRIVRHQEDSTSNSTTTTRTKSNIGGGSKPSSHSSRVQLIPSTPGAGTFALTNRSSRAVLDTAASRESAGGAPSSSFSGIKSFPAPTCSDITSAPSPRPPEQRLLMQTLRGAPDAKDLIMDPMITVVLFRIYGEDITNFYDSEVEVMTFETLSRLRIAPAMYAKGNGWRIEEWHFAKPVPNAILDNPSIYCQIASHLGRFHKLGRLPDFEFLRRTYRKPSVLQWLDSWVSKALKGDAERETPFFCGDLLPLRDEMSDCVQFLKELLQERLLVLAQQVQAKYNNTDSALLSCGTEDAVSGASSMLLQPPDEVEIQPGFHIVFCHNDCQENNVMQTQYGLRLIDFEYSAFNFQGHDIANFFNEWIIDYIVDDPPFFSADYARGASERDRFLFAKIYLSEFYEQCMNDDDARIQRLLDALPVFECGSHLLWGYWSLLRAPQTQAFDEFDFLEHAKWRFETARNIYYQLLQETSKPLP